MRRFILSCALALSLPVATGCSGITAKQKASAGAAITAHFVNGAHNTYSGELNARLDKCDPAVNPKSAVTTKTELDECLGKGFDRKSHEAVGVALKSYEVAARAFEIAISTDDSDALQTAIAGLLDAAQGLIQVLPEGSKLASKLKALVSPWA